MMLTLSLYVEGELGEIVNFDMKFGKIVSECIKLGKRYKEDPNLKPSEESIIKGLHHRPHVKPARS